MAKSELSCVYAALILADDDVLITEEKIKAILTAAVVEVEPYWPGLFANALQNCNVKDLITSINPVIGPNISDVDQNTISLGKDTQDGKNGAKTQEPDDESDDDPMDIFNLFGD